MCNVAGWTRNLRWLTYLTPAIAILGLHNRLVDGRRLQSVQVVRHDPLAGVVVVDAAAAAGLRQNDVVPTSRLLVRLVHLQRGAPPPPPDVIGD